MSNLQTNLKTLRQQLNLSQMELSKKSNISQSTIANIEKGRNEATSSTLITLSNFFGVTIDYLVGREYEDGRIIVQELPLPQDERRLINYYKDLPDKLKTAILEHAKTIYELNNNNLNTYDKRSN